MAAKSPRNRKDGEVAPLPISALPLTGQQGAPERPQSLPTGSSGKLTPAQRARLGLDPYGSDEPAAAEPPANEQPQQAEQAEQQTSDFGFEEMDIPQVPAADPAPKLAPVRDAPRLAPVGAARPAPATPAAEREVERARRKDRERELTVSERDGIPEVERDRSVLGYGVAWSFFCLFVAAVISIANVTSNPDMGPGPSALVPALISIVLGWVVVAIGHRLRVWGWLMIIPAVVLLIGPFAWTSWQVRTMESDARAYLSTAAAGAAIDIDSANILSATVNTGNGCFALFKERGSGDVRVDVVSSQAATAQQQATMALAPRFARRVAPGGARALQRSFTLAGGKLPVNVIEQASPAIDCTQPATP